ncbi:hypothetical protein [Massilia sp. CCM 8734]|uniref:hypothetical protein n=1 Tax=Massilia sp. CCM 8734 TaxID=2609283 RepID=UPI00141E0406|nr:hypothetical protein [Massilia sp. CCM 8734]NHZ99037.1 hypothetical protein [Massilia sp. CCM 8734]
MTVDIANYFAQLNDKKGKLERWETDIFQLHHAGVSYQNIADFLKLNGSESTKMEVYRFIHRKKRRHLLVDKPVIPTEQESVRRSIPSTSEAPVESAVPKPDHQENQSRPKFKFRESMGKEKAKW